MNQLSPQQKTAISQVLRDAQSGIANVLDSNVAASGGDPDVLDLCLSAMRDVQAQYDRE